ncbi:MAG TPA: CvpA family protein [Rhizomicrobium sp.]|jgi:membrane protein required for colicin V production|nr:CvpA family protein [Rhizomicrobium sp.]
MHGLNIFWVDVAVAAVVAISTLIAVLRGFVREVLSILAWGVAAVAAIWFGPAASAFLHTHISTPFVAPVLAYAGIFLLVLIPLGFASHYIAQSVRRSPISAADRCLGVPFGIVRGLALVGLVYFAFSLIVPLYAQPSWLTQARLLPVIRASSNMISSLLPGLEHSKFLRDESLGTDIRSAAHAYQHHRKIYQASDRRALDQLIANTSASGAHRQ